MGEAIALKDQSLNAIITRKSVTVKVYSTGHDHTYICTVLIEAKEGKICTTIV